MKVLKSLYPATKHDLLRFSVHPRARLEVKSRTVHVDPASSVGMYFKSLMQHGVAVNRGTILKHLLSEPKGNLPTWQLQEVQPGGGVLGPVVELLGELPTRGSQSTLQCSYYSQLFVASYTWPYAFGRSPGC